MAEIDQKNDALAIAGEIKTYALTNVQGGGCRTNSSFIGHADFTISEIPGIVSISAEKKAGPVGNILELVSLDGNGLKINIRFNEDFHVSITDVMGKVMWAKKGHESAVLTVHKSLFSRGVYAIRVQSGGKSYYQHVVLH